MKMGKRRPDGFFSQMSDNELVDFIRLNCKGYNLWKFEKENYRAYRIAHQRSLIESLVNEGTLTRAAEHKIDLPLPSREELYNEYVVQQLNIREIGKKRKISGKTISHWLKKLSIARDKPTYSKDQLRQLYIEEGNSMPTIAEILHTSSSNVHRLLKKFEIPSRNQVNISDSKKPVREQLAHLVLNERKSIKSIATHLHTGVNKVSAWCKEYNIPLRKKQASHVPRGTYHIKENRSIAFQDLLAISKKTQTPFLQAILEKLNVKTVRHLVD